MIRAPYPKISWVRYLTFWRISIRLLQIYAPIPGLEIIIILAIVSFAFFFFFFFFFLKDLVKCALLFQPNSNIFLPFSHLVLVVHYFLTNYYGYILK